MSTGPLARRAALALGLLVLWIVPAAHAAPIVPSGGTPSLPDFTGAPATPRAVKDPTVAPQNPFMAANPDSNIHNDTWMTDAYQRPGPLGSNLQTQSSAGGNVPSLCGSLAFDSAGHIVSVCPSSIAPPHARVYDPVTLERLADYELPDAPDPPGTKEYQNFSGGGYFFLDEQDRMWIPTKTDHIFVMAVSADGTSLTLERDYDLTPYLDTANERITSALPDFRGRIWFVSKQNGKVGVLNPKSGRVRIKKTGEEIENSFAVGADGVYVVSDKFMYRFKAHGKRSPRIIWKKRYPNSGIVKPSQVDAGSGTTPTIMEHGYVAITDNADPMNVVVFRNARRLHGEKRIVCKVPVFGKGKSATENSLITAGRSLIVENNYGYEDPLDLDVGYLTEPGFVRVDVKKNGSGCRKRWTNHSARAPTVVPKLSTANGLIYAYTMPPDPSGTEGYYWTAIDFRTGKTAWTKYAGSGLTYNNNYAGLALGADGTAYLGVIGGLIALRDG